MSEAAAKRFEREFSDEAQRTRGREHWAMFGQYTNLRFSGNWRGSYCTFRRMSGDVWSSLCGRYKDENLTWRALTSESEAPLKQFGFRKCGNCARVEASLRRKAAAAQEGEGNERAPADTA